MARLFTLVSVLTILAVLPGCGAPESDQRELAAQNTELKKQVDTLKRQVDELKRQVDELKNGAERLTAQIRMAIDGGNYAGARTLIKQLASSHPEAPANVEFAAVVGKLDAAEAAAKEKAAAEERERQRLANLNNTGMWEIRNYVDDFGNPTAKRYITNRERIIGRFNNVVTEGSPLGVVFLINSPTEIAIQLYEYNRSPPVKRIAREEYFSIGIQDSEGVKYYYKGTLYSDRIHIDDLETSGGTIPAVFTKGGTIKFRIQDVDDRSQYYFEFNPRFFDNALQLLSAPQTGK